MPAKMVTAEEFQALTGVPRAPERLPNSHISAESGRRLYTLNVRYWHKADIPSCTAHVRFRG